MVEFPVDYDLLDKQVRNKRFKEFLYTVFLNPGFVFLVFALGIFAVLVNDAHALYYSGIVVVSGWGVLICAGVWVVYIRLQEIAFEINRQHAKKE